MDENKEAYFLYQTEFLSDGKEDRLIHEACLQEEIVELERVKQGTIFRSQFQEFCQVWCPKCHQRILFREDFIDQLIPFADYTWVEHLLIISVVFGILTTIAILVYMGLTYPDQIGLLIGVAAFFVLMNIVFIRMIYKYLHSKFYRVEGEQHPNQSQEMMRK